MSLLAHRPARLRAVLWAGLLAVPLSLAAALPAQADEDVDPARVGLYGAADPTYDGVFRQSLGILGILAGGEEPSDEAVQWLLHQQCADGGFMSFNPTPAKACVAPDPVNFAGEDTNSTAVAVQALTALGHDAEAADAASFLAEAANDDGGWPYIPGGDSDPNSTGVVLMARSARDVAVSQDSVDYLAGIQVDCSGDPADQGGFTTAFSGGAPDALATVQAIPGVGGLHLDQLPAAGTPWADDAPAFACPVDDDSAETAAGWGSAWLEAQAQDDAISSGNAAWAVLSFATTRTGHDEAQDLYDQLLDSVGAAPHAKRQAAGLLAQTGEDPGLLGLTTLAGTALGADVSSFAGRIAATEIVAADRPSPSPSAKSGGDQQGGGTAAGGETLPDTGTSPGLVLLGAGMLSAGALLVLVCYRRRPAA